MRIVLVLLAAAALVFPTAACDLGIRAPAKPAVAPSVPPPADPDVVCQGGDIIADAVPLPIPSTDLEGTTVGDKDDDAEACLFWPDARDVVYSILPTVDQELTIVPSVQCVLDYPADAELKGEPPLAVDYENASTATATVPSSATRSASSPRRCSAA
jgi:hypothetical protein